MFLTPMRRQPFICSVATLCLAALACFGTFAASHRILMDEQVAALRRLQQTGSSLDLTATGATGGKTPAIIGVNVGHRYPGSNWPLWMKRQGVNGARVFLTSLWGSSLFSFVGSSGWGKSLSGVAVTSLTTFEQAVAELRTPTGHDPAAAAGFLYPVKWSTFDSKWVTTVNSSKADEQEGNHNATISTLAQVLPNAPVVVISCGQGAVKDGQLLDTNSSAYWASHWEVYKHFYAFSRYLWKRGITHIELYNEPDLDNDFQNADGSFKNALWVDAYSLRSRAIQNLYADMNAEDAAGADLIPDVHVGAYAKTQYNEGKMGQPAVQAMHQKFGTASPDAAWNNLQTYSYHSYGQSGKTILANFNELYTNTSADRTTQGQFPFSVTEFNAKTSGDFSTLTANMDQAAQAVKLGSQAINYATAGTYLTSIYVFKFSVTLSSGNGVTKNGIHWGDNIGAPYNIGDSALGAEALRLVAEKLAGAKDIQTLNSINAASLADTKTIAVRDGGAYYVHIVNTGTGTVTAALGMGAWSVPAGVPVVVERVNATHYGEVSEILTTNATRGVAVPLYPDNLVRVTVPAANTTLQSVPAAMGAQVSASSNSNTNYGSSTTMCVGTHPTNHTATSVTVMKFSVSNTSRITSAVLKLTLSSLSAQLTENMPMLLLGVPGTTWTGTNVTWSSLSGASGPLIPHPPTGSAWTMDAVSKNFVNYNTPGLQIVGHITLPALTTSNASGYVKMVDVTPFVKSSGGAASFVLLRPFRRNTEVATGDTMVADSLNNGTRACFHSAAATASANRPTLLVL